MLFPFFLSRKSVIYSFQVAPAVCVWKVAKTQLQGKELGKSKSLHY